MNSSHPTQGDVSNQRVEALVYKDTPGVGKQIFAVYSDGHLRGVLESHPIGYEPWRQFPAQGLNEQLDQVFREMVALWNERHATPTSFTTKAGDVEQ